MALNLADIAASFEQSKATHLKQGVDGASTKTTGNTGAIYNSSGEIGRSAADAWRPEDVAEWFLENGHETAAALALDANIDGRELLLLEEHDLADMGMGSKAEQAQVLKEIHALFSAQGMHLQHSAASIEHNPSDPLATAAAFSIQLQPPDHHLPPEVKSSAVDHHQSRDKHAYIDDALAALMAGRTSTSPKPTEWVLSVCAIQFWIRFSLPPLSCVRYVFPPPCTTVMSTPFHCTSYPVCNAHSGESPGHSPLPPTPPLADSPEKLPKATKADILSRAFAALQASSIV